MRADHLGISCARRRRRLAALALIAASALTVAGCASSAGAAAGTRAPLVLGAVLSLTGAGSGQGPQQARAIELAVSQVNAAGGIGGAPLRVVIRDDGSDPATGAGLMRQLATESHALAVIGPTTSDVATAADPVANQLHVPVVAVSNVVTGIVGHCAYPCGWIWRDSVAETVTVPDAISFAVQAQRPRAAAIIWSTPDLLGAQDAAIAASAFAALSVPVAADASAPENSANVDGAVRRALAGHPDALFVGSVSAQFVALVVHTARNLGFTGSLIGGNAMNSTATASMLGRAGLGAVSGAAWTRHVSFPANASFLQAYQGAYGQPADEFAAQAFTAVEILAAALHTAKPGWGAGATVAAQRTAVQSALADTALMTPLGPFRFTADHDVDQTVWIVAVGGGGTHTLVGFCNPGC